MYFLGVSTCKKKDTIFVILKKSLKNVKKHYCLKEIRMYNKNLTDKDIEQKIVEFYNDSNYIISKRIFNQNGRPPKNVKAHPKIIVNFTDKQTQHIERIRNNKIPVEGFSLSKKKAWEKEYCGIGLGNNYFVPLYDLISCLLGLYEQKRFIIEKSVSYYNDLTIELDRLKTKSIKGQNRFKNFQPDKIYDIMLILSTVLWFREKIPYKSKYITGSRGHMTHV